MISEINAAIEQNNFQRVKVLVEAIIEQHSNTFNFDTYHADNTFKQLWESMFLCLAGDSYKCIHKQCLTCIRLLSRDKTHLKEIVIEQHVNILLQCANLVEDTLCIVITPENTDVIVEGLKCLCNIVYNCNTAQEVCCSNKTVDCIMLRLRTYFEQNIPYAIKYFDIKLLFLLTAFNKNIRLKITEKLHGLTYLTEVLDNILRDTIEDASKNNSSCLQEENVLLSCEILKTLFNLTVNPISESSDEDNYSIWIRLISILRDLLVTSTFVPLFQDNIICNVVNLLTNVPPTCLDQLLVKSHWCDVDALKVIVNFLDSRLSSTENPSYENISPVLMVLLKGSRSVAKFRCEVRQQILPPLKDVINRPEQGNTLRNKLCRLLTTPNVSLCDLVAELLFVLCKENVGRMIKYTGFGNAAGLFANRGLLCKTSNPDYSSDSEDSDTEEYLTYKDQINPVLGCYEPPKPNPFECMSVEQQEHEVMQLVSKMDKLTREGVIQPCKIGDDGRPKPIEHVLQLQEELMNHFTNIKNKDGPDDESD
ncbi:PREDICTED: synembryn [Diuraphis noxia]|uniref:synembryn n=1 Tax=Diuraphis noxia TaxID=143948 RepID=UPI000763B5EC|nr:PREDICTED: synembryn [Diuraphis noxia]XP_015370466.1 PREDICTED: synembryn [Diuraphis noxia]XP_015370467.1 PREDICTED: synembryn [Diuraphis noxia]XP_015370468.1 PREDICTED: synembryn [Diuraphis noxia]